MFRSPAGILKPTLICKYIQKLILTIKKAYHLALSNLNKYQQHNNKTAKQQHNELHQKQLRIPAMNNA